MGGMRKNGKNCARFSYFYFSGKSEYRATI
nr:MAG TPA: hypothetical protein [Caudoviricetes sp.]